MSGHALAVDRRAVQHASNAVLGMVLFVISEGMFFMGFVAVYFTAYSSAKVWPPKSVVVPPIGLPTAATVVLILSVGTMAMAARAGRPGMHGRLVPWLAATLALAIVFAVLLGFSFRGLGIHADSGVYGGLFWVLNIVAIAHVIGGIVFFFLVLSQANAGELTLRQDPLQAAAIFWNFVAVIGIFLYTLLYLANAGSS